MVETSQPRNKESRVELRKKKKLRTGKEDVLSNEFAQMSGRAKIRRDGKE